MRRDILAWIGIGILVLAATVLALRHSSGTVAGFTNADFGFHLASISKIGVP